jgi:hypothetical protein
VNYRDVFGPQPLPMLRAFNMVKQLQESKAVIGLNMLALWDEWGNARTVDRAAVGCARRRHRRTGGPCRGALRQCPRSHRILAARENVGMVPLRYLASELLLPPLETADAGHAAAAAAAGATGTARSIGSAAAAAARIAATAAAMSGTAGGVGRKVAGYLAK